MKTSIKAIQRFTLTLFVLFLTASFGVSAQDLDWKWQSPLPTANSLLDIYFVDNGTGWAVGSLGTILKTSNGGVSWACQNSGTTISLRNVYFYDVLNGWTVGDGGLIKRTTDGGESWLSPESGTSSSLKSIFFIDAQTGWAVGTSGTILHTTNGGATWENQNSGTTNWLNSIHFTNSQIGCAVGWFGTILNTTNGGQSWQYQILESTSLLYSVKLVNDQTGFAVGQDGMTIKTTNGGQNWESLSIGATNTLYDIHFSDQQNGWAVGFSTGLIHTTDQGVTWLTVTNGTNNSFRSVHFSDTQTGWSIAGGIIYKSVNGGQSWVSQRKGVTSPLKSVHFSDNENGWTVGGAGSILKTIDGGQNWITQNSETPYNLLSVQFVDTQTGWIVGSRGIIRHTSNGGQTWQNQISDSISELMSVSFPNAQNGWALGYTGFIFRTSNGGEIWQKDSIDTLALSKRYYSVYFSDNQTGWVVGSGGAIWKTTNAGQSWQSQNSTFTKILNCVQFIGLQNGWAVGELGTILNTTNGGETWQKQISGTAKTLYGVHFSNVHNGVAVGANGTALRTTNGGLSWKTLNSGTTITLNAVHFTNPIYGWAAGEVGTIITTFTNNPIAPETPVTVVEGYLFEKTDTNCNPTDIPVTGKLVKAMPGSYYGYSNENGRYKLKVPLSDSAVQFVLEPVNPYNTAFQTATVCPPSGQISITADTLPDTLSGHNFGFETTACHHLDVQIASNRRRRCFQNTTNVSYQNRGALSASDGYILVEFPHWVRPVSSTRSYVALNDSVWRFNLGIVSAGSGGSFTISDSVICGLPDILGLSQCTKATIYPAPDCPAPAGWNGAEISVSGQCLDGNVSLGIYNKGSADMTDSVDYWVYLDSIQVKQAKVKLAAGDSVKLWVDAQGLSVHFTANQVSSHPSEIFVSTTVEDCSDTTIFQPRPTVNRFPKQQTPGSKTHCLQIRGSYDPNDKQAFPQGFTNQNIIPPNTQLEYLIRFQNSGTDTAFNVFVIDSLDQNLHVESFEMGAVSHPYQLSMQTTKSGKTFLRWQFNHILLPDSSTNELKSHGFVQYRISPKPGLALGSKVHNHAAIYFDYNPPIVTNQTLSTFDLIVFKDSTLNGNVQIVTSTAKQMEQELGVKLYPNPVTQSRLTASFSDKGSLTLFDARGAIVFRKTGILGIETIPVSLKSGFYFASVETTKGRKSVKLVVE